MTTTLYYFSGTGNTLAFTRSLQRRIENCEITSIPRVLKKTAASTLEADAGTVAAPTTDGAPAPGTPETAPADSASTTHGGEDVGPEAITGDAIGIVAPIYMHNMPHIVSRFIDRISHADYLFFVFTGGGELGRGLQKAISQFAKRGLSVSALFNVALPSNYTPYGTPDAEKRTELLTAAETAADSIATIVRERGTHFDENGSGFIAANVCPGPLYHLGYRFIPKMDGSFVAEDHCTRCGI